MLVLLSESPVEVVTLLFKGPVQLRPLLGKGAVQLLALLPGCLLGILAGCAVPQVLSNQGASQVTALTPAAIHAATTVASICGLPKPL